VIRESNRITEESVPKNSGVSQVLRALFTFTYLLNASPAIATEALQSRSEIAKVIKKAQAGHEHSPSVRQRYEPIKMPQCLTQEGEAQEVEDFKTEMRGVINWLVSEHNADIVTTGQSKELARIVE